MAHSHTHTLTLTLTHWTQIFPTIFKRYSSTEDSIRSFSERRSGGPDRIGVNRLMETRLDSSTFDARLSLGTDTVRRQRWRLTTSAIAYPPRPAVVIGAQLFQWRAQKMFLLQRTWTRCAKHCFWSLIVTLAAANHRIGRIQCPSYHSNSNIQIVSSYHSHSFHCTLYIEW